MPMSPAFENRIAGRLRHIADHFGTPFHLYDEQGIRDTGEQLKQVFANVAGFREYFAVKALPNPHILRILRNLGFGFDCSSIAELVLSRSIGAQADDIMFTSNNTSAEEFTAALGDGGCLLNLDDISLIDKLPCVTETICFRYNPGERRVGNSIIGNPLEAKYGITHEQVIPAYQRMQRLGVKQFGLHSMIVSNERDYRSMVETAQMLLEWAEALNHKLGIRLSFINIGGGLGIPYRPDDTPLNVKVLGNDICRLMQMFQRRMGYAPALHMESGRFITGPHGVLVTRAINHKHTYRHYIGVDASMSALMRPAMYGAYHHITVYGKSRPADQTVDIVGSLCENNDKFAVQRLLPQIDEGDLLLIHDTGAHGHAMGFNYNGRLRPQELLLCADGRVERIRRAETLDDYFSTLQCTVDTLSPPIVQEVNQ